MKIHFFDDDETQVLITVIHNEIFLNVVSEGLDANIAMTLSEAQRFLGELSSAIGKLSEKIIKANRA